MGILKGGLPFTGSIQGLSAYTMRGSDKIILRSKGGATKKQIQKLAAFEPTRNLNAEWKGVTTAALNIRRGLNALKTLADYNISGPLNALVKKIQILDTVNPKGRRSILLSHYPDFISSFSYNRQTLFDSIIRQPLTVTIDKTTGIIDFEVPALQQNINFFSDPRNMYFRLIFGCSAVGDYVFAEGSSRLYKTINSLIPKYIPTYSDWMPTSILQASANYRLKPFDTKLPGSDMILVFGAGIQYGKLSPDGTIQPVPYSGAARILKVV
jgi:hypothetical protein